MNSSYEQTFKVTPFANHVALGNGSDIVLQKPF